MRLIKLMAYMALGYLVYEFYQGLYGGEEGQPQRQGQQRRRQGRASNRPQRGANLSGGGSGTTIETEDAQGGRSKRVVGRGVTT